MGICSEPRTRQSYTRALEGTQEPTLPLLQAVTAWQPPHPLTGDQEGASHVLLVFKEARI